MSLWLQIAIIVVLTLANGFFAASEIAIVSARRGRLQQRAEQGHTGARLALQLSEDSGRFLATVQVGISLISVLAAAFGGDVLAQPLADALRPYVGAALARPLAFALVVVFITYLSLILGELVPKRLALQRAEALAAFAAPIMFFISRLTAPVVWFLNVSTQAVLRLLGRSGESEEPVTEEDVLSLVREGAEEGSLEPGERELIERVFAFTDATAREIMTPRTEIVAVSIEAPLDAIVDTIVESGYSRVPVYRGTLDQVEGIIYAKDLLSALRRCAENGTSVTLQELLRPPVFVLEHQRIASVLQQLKQSRTHLALVLDEHGQVDGLLTLEDVLEELTGDIADEYDEADTMVVRRSDGSWLVDGLLAYDEAVERIGLPPREQLGDLPPFDTVAGLLLALFGRIPQAGETTRLDGWHFEVVDMDGLRIDKVLVRRDEDGSGARATDEALAMRAARGVVPTPPPQPDATSESTNGG